MYSACDELGWNAGPLTRFNDIEALKAGDLLHLHWTKFVTAGATDAQEADRAVANMLGRLDRALARGVRFAWSVHEALPHECPYPAAEVALRQGLAERAEIIHTLHISTVAEVADLYKLQTDKVITVEHPLYSGFYPDYISREAARAQLGVGDEVVFLSFGAIRPYKGLDRLVDAARALRESDVPPFRILVVGPTYHAVDVQDVLLAAAKEPTISVMPVAVPNEYVHVLFRAADLSVLPYQAFHNSGVALLSLSFGTPVLLPETSVTLDLKPTGLASYFAIDDDADLLRQMEAFARTPPARSEMPSSVAADLDPRLAATRLASCIGPPR
jgi:beta-1,4-mannosyltransferase